MKVRKILVVLLAMVLVFSTMGCGAKESKEEIANKQKFYEDYFLEGNYKAAGK